MTQFACSGSLDASEVFKSKETNFNTTSEADAFSSQFLDTDSYSRRLGKKQQSAAAGGILERRGGLPCEVLQGLVGLDKAFLAEKGREPEASVGDVTWGEWREMRMGLNALYLSGYGR